MPGPRTQKDIFLAASELSEAAARARFLDEACAGDAGLRRRIEAVLAAEPAAEFLAAPAVTDEPSPQRGDAVGYFGDYILLAEIAHGSAGVVFRARQTSLNRVVALKMLRDRSHLASPDDEKRFRAEAEAAAGLDHAGIVPIYEVGRHEGQNYFSMKFIEGGTLHFRAAEFREPGKAVALIAKVARAVQHAHEHGILHRDLKPGNILIDAAGEPHITDFGIARHIGLDSDLTLTGQIIGTPHYMAPEQARGEHRGLTPAADIYSLGAVLYELLAGRKPFEGGTALELLRKVTELPPAPLYVADRDLRTIVLRCLEKAPAARYATAGALADDLERWLRGEPIHARPVGRFSRVVKWTRRRPVHAALVGLAALFVFTVAFFLRQKPHATAGSAPPPAAPAGIGEWHERVRAAGLLSGRQQHSAVWTGREVILWGGLNSSGGSSTILHFGDGARYDPVANSWKPMNQVGAPSPRARHSAVWTGREMLIWGGDSQNAFLSDGARYDPATDQWTPMSKVNAPRRSHHVTVWTGTKMIIWGGKDGGSFRDGGGCYDPATDTWTTVSASGLSPRTGVSAVWTGSEMIVFGGGEYAALRGDGARYDPATNQWTPLPDGTRGRTGHVCVWTGTEMLMWGGYGGEGYGYAKDGNRYDPARNTWSPMNTENAPVGRGHGAFIWTGHELLIWGGHQSSRTSGTSEFSDGARYDPVADRWTPMAAAGAPAGRWASAAAWTGTEFILWGGRDAKSNHFADGARYDPARDRWTATGDTSDPPLPRKSATAVWTGSEMIVAGGVDSLAPPNGNEIYKGGSYHPAANTWTPLNNAGAKSNRLFHSVVWTGREMIVWGGQNWSGFLNDGARFRAAANQWTPVNLTGAPFGRARHSAVWTGTEMIVWGGRIAHKNFDPSEYQGARYDPATDAWTATSLEGAPSERAGHTAIWTGTEMIVWGGEGTSACNDGARYDPLTDRWSAVTTSGAPDPRYDHTAVWTGSRLIVWGGKATGTTFASGGGSYDPKTNAWISLSKTNAPSARAGHTAVWDGTGMIVWGGFARGPLPDGARYDPATDQWSPLTTTAGPAARSEHAAVWTPDGMVIWGGFNSNFLNDMFLFTPR